MEPRDFTIKDVDELHRYFRAFRSHASTGWWFRGHADKQWRLLPKAGRPEYFLEEKKCLGRFRRWSNQAIAYKEDLPDNDWERLAVAQHFGLATCLLDWTQNPLVALYFACRELPDRDAAVYCYDPDVFVNEKTSDLWTAECAGIGFIPRAISPRILNQRGVFSVHLPADQPICVAPSAVLKDMPNLAVLHIAARLKDEMLKMLNDYGINHATLFPDLEGLSQHVNWEISRSVEFKKWK